MSKAAKDYYIKEVSPDKMAQGVVDAIIYALSKKS